MTRQHADPIGRRARRRHDGRADCRALRQRRRSGRCCSTSPRDAARDGLKRARALKPDPFFTPDAARADHAPAASTTTSPDSPTVDWIIEAVVEQLDVKQALLERVDARPARRHDRQLEHVRHSDRGARRGPQRRLPAALARHAFLQPAALSAPARSHSDAGHRSGRRRSRVARSPIIASARASSSRRTRRTSSPTTSALYGVDADAAARSSRGEYTIEEIDAITGPAIGRPKSATFRTMDIAGHRRARPRRAKPGRAAAGRRTRDAFALPPLVEALIERGWIGEKAGQGFYKRKEPRRSEILTLDPATHDLPRRSSRRGCRRSTPRAAIDDAGERIRTLFLGERQGRRSSCAHARADAASTPRASRPTSRTRSTMSIARCGGASAGSSDRSRSGTPSASARCSTRRGRRRLPPLVAERSRRAQPLPRRRAAAGRRRTCRSCESAKDRSAVVRQNAGASLVDLGDGVLARRVPLEDERDRRRHDPDAARRREGSRRELRGARRRQRRAELLGRRQPDAAAARSAGRQLGRDRPDGPRVPGRHAWRCATPTCRWSSRRPA